MHTPNTTPNPLLPFQLDPDPATETLTAFGGLPLVAQAFRSLGLPQSVAQHLHLTQRQRGFDEATMVERVVLLNAAGGDCPACAGHADRPAARTSASRRLIRMRRFTRVTSARPWPTPRGAEGLNP